MRRSPSEEGALKRRPYTCGLRINEKASYECEGKRSVGWKPSQGEPRYKRVRRPMRLVSAKYSLRFDD